MSDEHEEGIARARIGRLSSETSGNMGNDSGLGALGQLGGEGRALARDAWPAPAPTSVSSGEEVSHITRFIQVRCG